MRRMLTNLAIVAAILATAGCATRQDASKETLTTATELGDFGPRSPGRDGSGGFGSSPSRDPLFGGGDSAESGVFGGGSGSGAGAGSGIGGGSLVGGGSSGGFDANGNFVGPGGGYDSAGNFVGTGGAGSSGAIRSGDGSLAGSGSGSAGGFDSAGNYVGPSGQYDSQGNFVGSGGSVAGAGAGAGGGYDAAGNFVGSTGPYDASGNFVGGGSSAGGGSGSLFGGSGLASSDPTASGLDPRTGTYRDFSASATPGGQLGNSQVSGAFDGQAGLSPTSTLSYTDNLFDTSSASLDSGFSSSGAGSSALSGSLGGLGGGAASLAGINFPGDDGGARYFAQQVGDTVRFATDSSSLSVTAREILRRQAAWLVRHPNVSVTVEGHADERGPRDYNLALGARRANAARSYLTSLGISVDRIRTVSYGKERPIAVGSTSEAWAKNRRGVTVLRGAAAGF